MQRQKQNVVIPNLGTVSNYVQVPSGYSLIGFYTPAAITGSSFSFMCYHDEGDTPVPIFNGGSLLSEAAAANQYHAVDPKYTNGVNRIAIKSGSTEAADRTIGLIFGR